MEDAKGLKKQIQHIEQVKGRALLKWTFKKPLEKVEYYPAQEKEVYGNINSSEFNKLFWGDNMQVLSHMLKEYRGKVDLVYIDPPFDSKADYVRKVKLKGKQLEGEGQSLLEEKQYTDIWEKDEYLQFIYERLILIRELLSEKGSIYVHCDWHKSHHFRFLLDEVFGEENFVNEIIWQRKSSTSFARKQFGITNDTIFWYSKTENYIFNPIHSKEDENTLKYLKERFVYDDGDGRKYMKSPLINPLNRPNLRYVFQGINPPPTGWLYEKGRMQELFDKNELVIPKDPNKRIYRKIYMDQYEGQLLQNIWRDIPIVNPMAIERTDYPTQKPEALLERIIKASSNEGSLIMDCFCGSGTTLTVAERTGRKWLGCDINLGAIQITTKRLNQILLSKGMYRTGFKVYNVNDYDVFKNEIEAKEIIMEIYGITPIKLSYFDGTLNGSYVKIMPINRVLNKLDIKEVLKNIDEKISVFTIKNTSDSKGSLYEEKVLVICSGAESNVIDFIKRENKTGVQVEIKDILTEKSNLVFKQKPEAQVQISTESSTVLIKIENFYSPILMRKLEVENSRLISEEGKVGIENFLQVIDSVSIDVNYDGELFNAEIIDVAGKKNLVKSKYEWRFNEKGKYIVAVKIVDVLGEEYFETQEVEV